jgi:DNA-binding MarR family transcriptional regulator
VTDKPSRTVVRAWARLLKAQRIALGAVESALKDAGLPPLGWYDVLLEVERAGETGVRPFELERTMLLAQYNLSRLLDRIEKEGYLERRMSPDDGRGQLVHITQSGRAMRRRMWPVYASSIEAVMGERLKAAEAAELAEMLGKVIEPLPRA